MGNSIEEFMASEKAAKERDPEKYKRERAEDARQEYKRSRVFENPELMERAERMQNSKAARAGGGGAGTIEDPMKKGITNQIPSMKKGGKVAGKLATRGYGIAKKGC
jgi:hypothetical protein